MWTLAKAELPELEPDPDLPLPSVAQYFVNHDSAGRDRLHAYLHQELSARTAPLTAVHHLLPSIGLDLLWTSNYDDLIERAYAEAGRAGALDVVVSGADFSRPENSGKRALFKLHGSLADDSRIQIESGLPE